MDIITKHANWDIRSLMKTCKVCGEKPTLGTPAASFYKYRVACMNCTCTNCSTYEDNNMYLAIDKWNRGN